MKKAWLDISGVVGALFAAGLILILTTSGAKEVERSKIYKQSQIISSFFSGGSVSVKEIVSDQKNIDTLKKFVGALTTAYINFELIPVKEAGTFAAVFESVDDRVEVEKFEYHRKDLTIFGYAKSEEDYISFENSLRKTEYFASVSGSNYISTDNLIRFEILCIAVNSAG